MIRRAIAAAAAWAPAAAAAGDDVTPEGGQRTLTMLAPGDLSGEIALIGDGVRSASVGAEAPTEVLGLDFRALEPQHLREQTGAGATVSIQSH